MLYQVFAKINDIISSFKGNTFTKQEITLFCNKLYDTLIQADVPYDYTQQFVGYIRNKLMKMKNKNLNKQMVVGGIIRSYIENTFKQANSNGIHIKDNVVNVIGVYGPNGVGKTSFVAKLAKLFQKKFNKKILCVSFDTTRTSANKQLQILCNSNDIAYINVVEHNIDDGLNKIRQIVKYKMVDILLIDNAGISPDDRDGILMWKNVSDVVDFDEKIVVLDATFGQNASRLINAYVKIIHPTGFAVSKSDSDHKGGVFFAIATFSDKPIYYVLNGEKIDNIYEFKTSMILDKLFGNDGNKDHVLSSLKMKNREYLKTITVGITYYDFFQQLDNLIKYGNFTQILSILPHTKSFLNVKLETEAYMLIKKWMAIISSMTLKEQHCIDDLSINRMNRIAKGSGTGIEDVVKLKLKIEDLNKANSK